ncbi:MULTISPECIES: lytic transglycosylase domain-containing protein [unclassified Novosphingobium]|uniref:lytic transglycosylase domain-containing protein n=1 Tax=unclassified Novosphingobium TaxID=2644732 RepID=UPI000EBE7D01|nr:MULTISPECIES: lytic transglycosylase domain-containing protein [unclassified Novosphingobium]HCF24991.1 lytic murein transglycosylase [Novosphingobium sp.]HQV03636.1 lytic transglycosylase domain-containing protein [Novosphingobium sp.]
MEYFAKRANRSEVPSLLGAEDRAFYRDLFAAIERGDWTKVQAMFAQRPDGPLHQVARAEYFLAPNSPKIELEQLDAWLARGVTLPQAEQIVTLAQKRGATSSPALPQPNRLVSLPSFAKRIRPRESADGTMPGSVAAAINGKIKADDPAGAKAVLDGIDSQLSPRTRAEWRSKVAWSFYIENNDAGAYALAQTAQDGAGPWVAEGWWIAGLAAWRMDDCTGAADAFGRTAQLSENAELTAAGHYWQSRALVRCRQPEKAALPLKAAARMDETLYGMLAIEQLGVAVPKTHEAPDFTQSDWQSLRDVPNVRAAVMLSEIGQDGLADEVLRHQAKIGMANQYQPLSRLARSLGMPGTQMWMAYNAPPGGKPEPAARFPTPKWTPVNGWKVDPALVYAHTLQESVFRTKVVSPAGARGLMQIMPAAAKDHAAKLGVAGNASDLGKPEVNLAFGQKHLEMLRDSPGTQGLLPKVMAAYNAGLTPIGRWRYEIRDKGDPLLWIESVPYWETRGYVNIVMRNYWMYERQAGGPSESRMALAQGLWPTFPGLAGSQAVRMRPDGTVLYGR